MEKGVISFTFGTLAVVAFVVIMQIWSPDVRMGPETSEAGGSITLPAPVNWVEAVYNSMNQLEGIDEEPQAHSCAPLCKKFTCKPSIIYYPPYKMDPLKARDILKTCDKDIEKQSDPWTKEAVNTDGRNMCPGNTPDPDGFKCRIERGYGDISFKSTFFAEPIVDERVLCKESGPFPFSVRGRGTNALGNCAFAGADCFKDTAKQLEAIMKSCPEGCTAALSAETWKKGITSEGPPCEVWAEVSGTYSCLSTPNAPKKWKVWKEVEVCFPCDEVR